MSLLTIFDTIFIGPLKLVFEVLFALANRVIAHPGLCIVVLSLMMNILVLPLYRRADALQEQARDMDAKLKDGVAHIKKHFSGDERMMILQTYYRQNNYSPLSALNGSLSLLLEIPFFMAAYQFLSHVTMLNGVSLGPIADLGAPDGMLVLGVLTVNVLPILMTLINLISGAIYLKGFPLKSKVQLYGIALVFLVFLYNSPAGLVFYWTLNNVFSLVKNIFYKLKNPKKILLILTSVAGLVLLVAAMVIYQGTIRRKLLLIAVALVLELPAVFMFLRGKFPVSELSAVPDRGLFLLGAIFLTVLVGALIPSAFLAASPQEYVDVTCFRNPLWHLASAFCYALGFFAVWFGVFYWLANSTGKVLFETLLCAASLGGAANYMFFGTDLGLISANLQYDNGVAFSAVEQMLNLLILFVVCATVVVLLVKYRRFMKPLLLTGILAVGCMSVWNVVTIQRSVQEISGSVHVMGEEPELRLSRSGSNVVVVMIDRAMGQLVPYLVNEKPELEEMFDGFTYYANTISFGASTNIGTPALYGGYEYTPVEMNKRSEESLMSKHNEALKVMPVLFLQEGYEVTVCDPVYANYQSFPDFSVFKDYPEMNTYVTNGYYIGTENKQTIYETRDRNLFCLSLMKAMPLVLQGTLYDGGRYNQMAQYSGDSGLHEQVVEGLSKATGISTTFMTSYSCLEALADMTVVTDDSVNTFMYMANNNSVHDPILLQEGDYVPAEVVDNTEYDALHVERFMLDGKQLVVENSLQMRTYQSMMATMLRMGEWFDYLREMDVYDNTRIILVADHGHDMGYFPELRMNDSYRGNAEAFWPLLMVKDFNSRGFETSDVFMTNADVPVLAVEGLIEQPVNPFTGVLISDHEKFAHEQYVSLSGNISVEEENGNTFLPCEWASVKEDLRVTENWTFYEEEIVLDHYALSGSAQ